MEIELNIKSNDNNEIQELFRLLSQTKQKIEIKTEPESEPQTIEKVKFPKIHGKARETVLQMLYYYNGGTINELIKHTDIKRSSLSNILSTLVKEGLAETSSTWPKVYYIKGENAELKEVLKNVPKGK